MDGMDGWMDGWKGECGERENVSFILSFFHSFIPTLHCLVFFPFVFFFLDEWDDIL